MLDDPVYEYSLISAQVDELTTEQATVEQIVCGLERFLQKRFPVKIEVQQTRALDPGDFTVAGFYDHENDQNNLESVILVLVVNYPTTGQLWQLSDQSRAQLKIEILESLVHEMQHRYQYQQRNYLVVGNYHYPDLDNKQQIKQYFSHTDEIDAYAANIAARVAILNDMSSPDLAQYCEMFGHDHRITKQLKKKVFKNLALLQIT